MSAIAMDAAFCSQWAWSAKRAFTLFLARRVHSGSVSTVSGNPFSTLMMEAYQSCRAFVRLRGLTLAGYAAIITQTLISAVTFLVAKDATHHFPALELAWFRIELSGV